MEDEYFFGEDILVAPLFEAGDSRRVYLSAGQWVELGTNHVFRGGCWHTVQATVYPGLAFVRAGAVLPMAAPALTTDVIDWSTVQNVLFTDGEAPVHGHVFCAETMSAAAIDPAAPVIPSTAVMW